VDTEILKQLVWIKWLLGATTILIGLFVALIAVMAKGFIRYVENNARHHSFQELAKGLLDIGKAEDVLALAELRARSTQPIHRPFGTWRKQATGWKSLIEPCSR
jgi:hypothetical protein